MEIRKAPNDTAALSFAANSEAARYVFVVVAAADVMDRIAPVLIRGLWPMLAEWLAAYPTGDWT